MTKYREYYLKMLEENKDLFDEFTQIHFEYSMDENKQSEFNKIGEKVMKVIRAYEDKLCGRSENNGYASFTGGLAQKFQDEIRKSYPLIDNIGIIIEDSFTIKKIKLKN